MYHKTILLAKNVPVLLRLEPVTRSFLHLYSRFCHCTERKLSFIPRVALFETLNNKLTVCELHKADQNDKIEARGAIKGIVIIKRKLIKISPSWSLSLRLNDLYMTVRCISEVKRVFMCG